MKLYLCVEVAVPHRIVRVNGEDLPVIIPPENFAEEIVATYNEAEMYARLTLVSSRWGS